MSLLSHPLGYKCDPETGDVFGLTGKRLRGCYAGDYLHARTKKNKRPVRRSFHRLMAEAAWGEIPAGIEVNHINGDKLDNRLVNLELVTRGDNAVHAGRIGLRACRKLSEEQAKEVRDTVGVVASKEWARRLGVSDKTIYSIRKGKTYPATKKDGSPHASEPKA